MIKESEYFREQYNQDILAQGQQYQIDHYYQPKEKSMQRRIELVLKLLNPGRQENILDLGCGVGTFAYHAAVAGALTSGVDYSVESIKMAQSLAEKYGLAQQIKYYLCDARKLCFPDNSFDKIISVDFIEHVSLKEKQQIIQEIYRVLKPKGQGLIFTPNGYREKLGEFYWWLRHVLFADKIPQNQLHFGLTNKFAIEKILRENNFSFKLFYADVTRPYLAQIPLLRAVLALNLIWVIKK